MKKLKTNLTQDRLKELLVYDANSGRFVWQRKKARANKGDVAGGVSKDGYRYIRVDGVRYLAHRLAWFYVHGYFPEGQIDHIDRAGDNNRISNLREVTHSCNQKNRKVTVGSKSGILGVRFCNKSSKWQAFININQKVRHLGYFQSKSGAAQARYGAEVLHGWADCDRATSAKLYLESRGLSV